MTRPYVESEQGLIAAHVIGARDSFARVHPRIDRAELDVLADDVIVMNQLNSGWRQVDSSAHLVNNDINCLTSAKTVFASSDHPEQVIVQATHPVLFREDLDYAFQGGEPDEAKLNTAFIDLTGDGIKPMLKVVSLGERERRGATTSRPTLAVAKFRYDATTGRVITRVGTRVIPEGRTAQVSYEMPAAHFGELFKQVVDQAAPRRNSPQRKP